MFIRVQFSDSSWVGVVLQNAAGTAEAAWSENIIQYRQVQSRYFLTCV